MLRKGHHSLVEALYLYLHHFPNCHTKLGLLGFLPNSGENLTGGEEDARRRKRFESLGLDGADMGGGRCRSGRAMEPA